jgi:hypothetical protein
LNETRALIAVTCFASPAALAAQAPRSAAEFDRLPAPAVCRGESNKYPRNQEE